MFTAVTISIILLLGDKIICSLATACALYQTYLMSRNFHNKTRTLGSLLIITLFCHVFVHISWTLKLIDKLIYPVSITIFSKLTLVMLRLAGAAFITGGLTFLFFLEKLSNENFQNRVRHWLFITVAMLISIITLIGSVVLFHSVIPGPCESALYQLEIWYILIAALLSLVATRNQLQKNDLPRIVKQQVKTLTHYLLIPHTLIYILCVYPSLSTTFTSTLRPIDVNNYIFIILSDLFLLTMMFFCIRRILCLRFLNLHNHVQPLTPHYHLAEQLKETIIQLGKATSFRELEHTAALFFTRAFHINYESIRLYVRERHTIDHAPVSQVLPTMEAWLTEARHAPLCEHLVATHGILIRDELEFDYFYDKDPRQRAFLNLLDTLHADVIVPVYEKHTITAYIIMQQGARPYQLFSNVERDKMCVFASYVSSLVYLFQHKNFSELIRQERTWREEVYHKQQEANHYRESIKTLLAQTGHRTTGIIHYQRRKLSWASETARALFTLEPVASLSTMRHSFELKHLAQEAIRQKKQKNLILYDNQNRPIHCVAFSCDDYSQSIILVYRPDIADTFTIPFDRLKDISSWDYALLLETTASGKLINQLIPSSTEIFLNFKIDLLKVALTKKATLLEIPEADQIPTVNIIHHISLRSKLHVLNLESPEQDHIIGIQLFGVKPIIASDTREGLLATLHDVGTLFIKHVELLSLDTQERLATYMTTGMFQPVAHEVWHPSNVRIICSTSNNLATLVAQGAFSPELYQVLRTTALMLPSLSQIPQHELVSLAQGLCEQAIQSKELRTLLQLTNHETSTVVDHASTSICGFKQQVTHTIRAKSQRKKTHTLVQLEPDGLSEFLPEVAQAIRLGKKALKDRRIMHLLWNTFQSQSKIATLLNVNRSSVNRRLKEYKFPSSSSSE